MCSSDLVVESELAATPQRVRRASFDEPHRVAVYRGAHQRPKVVTSGGRSGVPLAGHVVVAVGDAPVVVHPASVPLPRLGRMGSWLVERRLRKNVAQLRAAREELAIADEQSFHLDEGAGDVEAMDRHREVMRRRIADLQAEQDRLLDQLGGAS